jgi:hypothetical protein
MRAVTRHGKRDVRVDTVPSPKIEQRLVGTPPRFDRPHGISRYGGRPRTPRAPRWLPTQWTR